MDRGMDIRRSGRVASDKDKGKRGRYDIQQ